MVCDALTGEVDAERDEEEYEEAGDDEKVCDPTAGHLEGGQ